MEKKDAYVLIEEKLKIAREALDEAAKLGKENKVHFSFSATGWNDAVPFYPGFTPEQLTRYRELKEKRGHYWKDWDKNLSVEEQDELANLSDLGMHEHFNPSEELERLENEEDD